MQRSWDEAYHYMDKALDEFKRLGMRLDAEEMQSEVEEMRQQGFWPLIQTANLEWDTRRYTPHIPQKD